MFTQATPAVMGRRNGYNPGVLQRQEVNKVVVLGNSITMHSPADYWEVNDYREMSASRPDTGWVTLLRNYLNEIAPVSVYKTNLATWETENNGSRSLSHSLNNPACEVIATGADYTNMTTLASVLNEDVDCIIIQVYENVGGINTRADSRTLIADYLQLYKDLVSLCPNAQIIQTHLQFTGNFDFTVGEIFYTNTVFTNLTGFDNLLISGKYNFTGSIGVSASHGQLTTELGVNTTQAGYFLARRK
jgi:hypothetical protein